MQKVHLTKMFVLSYHEEAVRRIIASLLDTICATLDAHPPAILDVSCGTGANLDLLQRFGEVEGVDISDAALAFC